MNKNQLKYLHTAWDLLEVMEHYNFLTSFKADWLTIKLKYLEQHVLTKAEIEEINNLSTEGLHSLKEEYRKCKIKN